MKPFTEKEEDILTLWILEVEMAMNLGMVRLEHQRVALAISKFDNRAPERAFTSRRPSTLLFRIKYWRGRYKKVVKDYTVEIEDLNAKLACSGGF